MSLINLDNISIAFGHVALLDKITLRINNNERICLIGRNGEGKSTLLKIITQELAPDQGKVEYQQGVRIAQLSQEPQFDPNDSVFHAVAKGLGIVGELLEQYYYLAQQIQGKHDQTLLNQLENIQQRLEAKEGWDLEQKVKTVLSKLDLPIDNKLGTLSGGWKRRVALAQVLVKQPDLLLLDEPTNHLDIDTIIWLENTLLSLNGGLLFVSHDRRFVERVATRMIELDRGKLTDYPSNYATYLQKKQEMMEVEATQAAKFDKQLAKEEVWIRQGIKARRTRNEGRVRTLKKLRQERAHRRDKIGQMRLHTLQSEVSGRIVIEAENISYAYEDNLVIQDFSTLIMRGDRIGLIGGNGVGKTTLLKILLGDLIADKGEIKHGTKLQIAYFDQLRDQLNPEETVIDAVAQGREMLTINGQSKHIISYLADFLFAPERVRSPVKSLSGGERNRLLLARLFTNPANVLVLDEPTNDLDIESLELLEELLCTYTGTLLLVSHDRYFLDNVVTSTFIFEGNGKINEYVGGYQDWLEQRSPILETLKPENPVAKQSKPKTRTKLNFNQQQELKQLPEKIDVLEIKLTELQTLASQADFYQREAEQINQSLTQINSIETELKILYERWELLET
ncbi:MAG: ATP-binding cassette domain-containing protein [Thiomargarita sp.]|nr:ATP-binding cassette domain-containing protein [Thiomargarita sp.]